MALLRCDFFSEALSLSTSMTVLLPQRTTGQVGLTGAASDDPPPVLYLLHGMSDDATTWVRRTSVERYVAPLGLAVVMPQVHRSYYTDEAYGGRFWTFLTEELPALVHDFFRVSERREDTFVAGLSMGGYGAFKWALRDPGRFAAAASLSGALDVAGRTTQRERPEDPRMTQRLFGDEPVAGTDADLLHLVAGADVAALPALRAWCGTEDGLLEDNRRFAAACDEAGVPLELHEGPGQHDWAYWDARIVDVLDWLPLRTRG
ncbi:alpha/beta hydrolase family protein [Microlunatus spumicola]|uniref:Alpha/beta hydrolase family protein n=1 Tax=Microlunatus spumicola TaxID=81499 RepID=A0ABP6X0V6_9ACTN